jgi:hypothetical protein
MSTADEFIATLIKTIQEATRAILKVESRMSALETSQAKTTAILDKLESELGKQNAIEKDRQGQRKENLRFFEKILDSKVAEWILKILILIALGGDAASRIIPEVFRVPDNAETTPLDLAPAGAPGGH